MDSSFKKIFKMADDIQMKSYRAPENTDKLPDLDLVRKKPRAYLEWKTLRLWERLPTSERDVPGYLLRLAREKAGLTQQRLADELEITQQAVAQAERWTSNPSFDFMKRWARACGSMIRIELK